jgi:predicted Zn-dependent protease
MVQTPSRQQALARANQLLQQGDLGGAEQILTPLMMGAPDAPMLGLMGLLRLRQNQPQAAAHLLARARDGDPREALHAFYLGKAKAALGETDAAEQAWRAAIKLKPDLTPAYFELAVLQQRAGDFDEAENTYRKLLRLMPGHSQAKLMLAMVMMEAGKPGDAETILRRALAEETDAPTQSRLRNGLAWAMRRQNRNEEALAEFEAVRAIDPAIPFLDIQRAEILHDLKRSDEAIAVFRQGLAREPQNPQLHKFYNDLLYRLDRREDYLKSYDRAPASRELMLDKASFLALENRAAEAHAVYQAMLMRDPADPLALAGAAQMLSLLGRHQEASQAFNAILSRQAGDPAICNQAAQAALLAGDPEKSVALYQQSLRLVPHDQESLAGLSVALRLMGDARDEALNGYDALIQSFDLEPPDGFSSMADFNAELNAYLDRLHPESREYLRQSLRGGTQTPAQLFNAGHELVQKIKARIDEAVARYIAGLKEDAAHPFLSRRAADFRYAGSWSSRLRDRGFHVNHIHPGGWISSCYYVAVPPAVKDGQQGWIKFGEPSFAAPLADPIRRAIQPEPGRLVLFPSYMWHGTVPFHDAAARTTIAFDVVPTA